MPRLEIIRDVQDFEALRGEWNGLLEASSANCLFLTWEWLHTWWRHLAEDRRLFIITLRENDELIAIAPLALRPRRFKRLLPFRALEFLGAGNVGSDYLNLIIRCGHEATALPLLVEALEDSGFALQLSQIDSSSSLLARFQANLAEENWRTATVLVDPSPYVDLSDHSFDSYIATRGRSHRTNVRRRLKKLHKLFDVRFERARDERQRATFLEHLINLHLSRWNDKGGSTALHSPGLQEFHQEFSRLALERGWLRLYALGLDAHIAAALYCFLYDGKYYFYQTGFDTEFSPYSVGLCAIGLCLEQAIAEGASEFDFLRGGESYKYLWANQQRSLLRLDGFPPDLGGRLSMGMMAVRQELKRFAAA